VITDGRGRRIAFIQSASIVLNPGSNSLSNLSVVTRKQQYFLQGLADFETVQGSLPSGTYTVCYTASCVAPDCDGIGQGALFNEFSECVQLTIEPPTPLLLAYPDNGSELDVRRPGFMWIPPMPIAQVTGFNYVYSLYLAQKGQSCNEAVLMNPPLFRAVDVGQPSMPFPAELDDLDTGKTYCWKVDGQLSGMQVAQSEAWELRIRREEQTKDTIKYIRLRKYLDGGFVIVNPSDHVYFMLEGSYRYDTLNLQITGDHGTHYSISVFPLVRVDSTADATTYQ
jgi:hypothetical protein